MQIDISRADSTDMRSHIRDQGVAAQETLKRTWNRVQELADELSFKRLVMNGAGDKYIVPYIASFLWKAFSEKPVEVIHSRTLADNFPRYIDRDTLVIFVSQSGRTKDTMDAARRVASSGAKMIAVTNLREKEENSLWFIEDEGGAVLNTYTPTYPERALPSTMTFHSSLILLYSLLSELAGLSIQNDLRRLADSVDRLSRDGKVEMWGLERAHELVRWGSNGWYVLGDGPRYGIARKLALIMFMEGAKVNAFPLETEEFLHSLVETLEEENPYKLEMINFLPPEDQPMRKPSEKISRVWREHTSVIDIEPPKVSNDPLLNNLLSPQAQMVSAEWMAYYLALLRGIDPGVGHIVKKVRSGSW